MSELPTPEWERETEAAEQSGQDDDPPSGEYEQHVTYVALEGINPAKIDEPERERLEKNIEELVLVNHGDLPLEGARVITSESEVIEVIETDA